MNLGNPRYEPRPDRLASQKINPELKRALQEIAEGASVATSRVVEICLRNGLEATRKAFEGAGSGEVEKKSS